MKFIFKNGSSELILPVTPESFQVSHGIAIETINIHTLGDVAVAGYGTLADIKIDCMFPAKYYPFNQPSAVTNPYSYTSKLEALCDGRTVCRFIISDTTVNLAVLINEISYGEQDGTGDVYAAIALRQYRQVTAVPASSTGNSVRTTTETSAVTAETYIVLGGDTLSAIARKFYGSASLYSKLASYNGIKNANLIKVGQVIKIPDKSLL